MSAVETTQISASETGQMSSLARTDICLVLTHNVDVSEISTVQVSDRRSGPKSTKMARNGSRMVARSWESTPGLLPAIFSPLGLVPRPKTAKI